MPVRAEGAPSFLSVFLLLLGGEGACVTTLLEMPFSVEHFSGPRDKTSDATRDLVVPSYVRVHVGARHVCVCVCVVWMDAR